MTVMPQDSVTPGEPPAGPQPATPRHGWAWTKNLIRDDLAFRCARERKVLTRWTGFKLLWRSSVACGVRYRMQCFFYANHMAPFGWFLKFLNVILYGVQIDERAQIGGGLLFPHAISILISDQVTIGERCILFHETVIGPSPFFDPDRRPGPVIIGNDVIFANGACAYGDIVIGDACRIGPNSVVNQSYPANTTLYGVPAKATKDISATA